MNYRAGVSQNERVQETLTGKSMQSGETVKYRQVMMSCKKPCRCNRLAAEIFMDWLGGAENGSVSVFGVNYFLLSR
jgi:hypothetical protein